MLDGERLVEAKVLCRPQRHGLHRGVLFQPDHGHNDSNQHLFLLRNQGATSCSFAPSTFLSPPLDFMDLRMLVRAFQTSARLSGLHRSRQGVSRPPQTRHRKQQPVQRGGRRPSYGAVLSTTRASVTCFFSADNTLTCASNVLLSASITTTRIVAATLV